MVFKERLDNPCEFTEEEIPWFIYKVTDIDVIEYNGVRRKRLKLENPSPLNYGYWVEGIGCMRGITEQISSQLIGGVYQLKDCYQSDELIFVNENPEYCWIYPTKTSENQQDSDSEIQNDSENEKQ